MELEVYPAFSQSDSPSTIPVPSLDPESLATILLLDSDHASNVSPLRILTSTDINLTLPRLHLSASRSPSRSSPIISFDSITSYIYDVRSLSSLEFQASQLSPVERAANAAQLAHLRLHLQPLLDLYLYIDWRNWSEVVRPALSQAVGGAKRYVELPRRRGRLITKLGERRVGLVERDIEDDLRQREANLTRSQQGWLQGVQKAGMGTLGMRVKEMQARGDRRGALSDMVKRALEPLAELVKERSELDDKKREQHQPGSVSPMKALALSYLVIIHALQLPNPWLKEETQRQFPGLEGWMSEMLKGSVCDPNAQTRSALLVHPAPPAGLLGSIGSFGVSCVPDGVWGWVSEGIVDKRCPKSDQRLIKGGMIGGGAFMALLAYLLTSARGAAPTWMRYDFLGQRGGPMIFGRQSLASMR